MKTIHAVRLLGGLLALTVRLRSADQPHDFTIPLDRQQMIGVTYATVETKPLQRTVRAVGLVAATTGGEWDTVARVDGYVHQLFVAAPGDRVERGQVLLDLYSPDVVATENEYLDLLRMRDAGQGDHNPSAVDNAGRLLAAARARLSQWNIPDSQIDALESTGVASPYLRITAGARGIVEQVAVRQGARVAAGDSLVKLADLSSVWIWAEFYENELPLLRPGLAVTLTSSSLPGFSVPGRLAVVDPFINEMKRTGRVRFDAANPDGRLWPGAYVDVTLVLDAGVGLTIPCDAVLPTGEHDIVFVDRGGGRLEPRYVQLGGKYGESYAVTAGLNPGERVVSSANFLVDAESKIQGALKSW